MTTISGPALPGAGLMLPLTTTAASRRPEASGIMNRVSQRACPARCGQCSDRGSGVRARSLATAAADNTGPPLTIGAVTCPLISYNPTHFKLGSATTVTCTIDGAERASSAPDRGDGRDQEHSELGNEYVQRDGFRSRRSHSPTPGGMNGCETTNIGFYDTQGTTSDDGPPARGAHAGVRLRRRGTVARSRPAVDGGHPNGG